MVLGFVQLPLSHVDGPQIGVCHRVVGLAAQRPLEVSGGFGELPLLYEGRAEIGENDGGVRLNLQCPAVVSRGVSRNWLMSVVLPPAAG